jgi:hypothetical protein
MDVDLKVATIDARGQYGAAVEPPVLDLAVALRPYNHSTFDFIDGQSLLSHQNPEARRADVLEITEDVHTAVILSEAGGGEEPGMNPGSVVVQNLDKVEMVTAAVVTLRVRSRTRSGHGEMPTAPRAEVVAEALKTCKMLMTVEHQVEVVVGKLAEEGLRVEENHETLEEPWPNAWRKLRDREGMMMNNRDP